MERILRCLPSQLNAKKKEVVDTDALIERYRKEIEELKARLAEREADVPVRNRRLSAREVRLSLSSLDLECIEAFLLATRRVQGDA